MTIKDNVNATALVLGVTTLFTAVGGLSATGALGRLERNEPEALAAAIVLVLLGAGMLVLAGIPVTSGWLETLAILLGAGLTVIGLGWALIASVRTASQHETPAIDVSVSDDAKKVAGTVTVGNLHSEQQFTVLVEGLKVNDDDDTSKKWDVFTIGQYYVGPDGDGSVKLPVSVLVSATAGYDAIGVKAYVDDSDTCGKYPRRVAGEQFKLQVEDAGRGCVVMPYPKPEPKTTPTPPTVKLAWVGPPATTTRVRLRASTKTAGGIVLLVANERRAGRTRELMRTVHTAPGGSFATANLRVQPDSRRVCAVAVYVDEKKPFRRRFRTCPLRPRTKSSDAVTRPSGG
jgi:hypothetical protein